MSCSSAVLKGIINDCAKSKGGVTDVFIAPAGTFKPTVTDNAITSGTTSGFKYYYFRKNTASMTSTLNIDETNGVNYWSTELAMTFTRMETVKRLEIATLAVQDVECIVRDSNGLYWFLGNENPVTANAGSGQTGQAKTDGNFYQITLVDESDELPYEITSDEVKTALEAIKSGQA